MKMSLIKQDKILLKVNSMKLFTYCFSVLYFIDYNNNSLKNQLLSLINSSQWDFAVCNAVWIKKSTVTTIEINIFV